MEVQFAADLPPQLRAPAVAKVFLTGAAIFAVARDRMADLGHMGAQLMGPPGHRHQRHPGGAGTQRVDDGVIGRRPFRALGLIHLGRMDGDHLLALAPAPVARRLDEAKADRAHLRIGQARDGGPVDLARRAGTERLGQCARDAVGPGQQQNAGRVLVQPVNQLRPVLVAEHQRSGEAVHMPVALPRPALRRQARRLVQRDDMVVLPQHRRLNHPRVVTRDTHLALRRGGVGFRQGRHPDLRPRPDPGGGLDPTAIDADLPGAAHLFDRALGDLRKALLQPAVETAFALGLGHGQGAQAAHARTARISATPVISARIDTTTESPT